MQQNKRRKRGYAVPLGGIILTLGIIGIASIALILIRMTFYMVDNTKEKAMFERIVQPLVMFDPVPFEKASDIDSLSLLQYSMWAVLLSDTKENYAYDENGELVVPASDLDVAAAGLFGGEVKLSHQSFGDYETIYYYDEKNKVYLVPIIVQLLVYTPQVEEIQRNGDIYTIRVGYIPPGSAWTANTAGVNAEPTPDKYMYYDLQRSKNGYQILALRDPPNIVQPTGGTTAPK